MTKRLVAAIAGLALLAGAAAAEDYPARPIHLIVPYPAGGANDIFARLVGQKLNDSLGKPVVIENRAGASTMIASAFVAKAAPDGYTLLLNNSTLGITTILYKTVPYRLDDFTFVAPVANSPIILVVNQSSPLRSVADLVAAAKAAPGKLNYAATGPGGATHLISEHFNRAFGVRTVEVDYRGAAPLLTDLLGGQVDFYFEPVNGSMDPIKAGQLRALAVTSEARLTAAPDVPTFKELGTPAMTATIAYGIFGPAHLPADVTAKLNKAIGAAVSAPDVNARLEAEGDVPVTATPAEFSVQFRANLGFWADIIRPLKLQLD
ncbi:MAG: tripartite tricarboxylate transporter substrate binding protein [Alphaproteobacteria bacterium]|nr:tripartite tricarboxylate transporter substrate binding protein [Alphaproteobacteria bacterium]